jgi:hypothetical protein
VWPPGPTKETRRTADTGYITAFSGKENDVKNVDGITNFIDNFIKLDIVIVTQTFLTTFHHQKTYLPYSFTFPIRNIGYGKESESIV